MHLNRPLDPRFADDLSHAADMLDVKSFQSLSTGLGLGSLKPVIPVSESVVADEQVFAPIPAVRASTETPESMPFGGSMTLALKQIHRKMAILPPWRLFRWLSSHLADLLIVGMTGLVALSLAGYLAAAGDDNRWAAATDILTWLSQLGGVYLLAGIYLTFAAYYVFFRLITGKTPGDSLISMILPVKPDGKS